MTSKIIVCCHKQDIYASQEPYLPIQVGRVLAHTTLDMVGDDTGDNISSRNGSYCELTGMYWAWKNLKDVDVIGLCHYRRYFDFHGQTPSWAPHSVRSVADFSHVNLDVPDDILRQVGSGAVLTPRYTNCQLNMMADYSCSHNSDDFKVLQHIVCQNQPEDIKKAFYQVMYCSNNRPSYNMFIMKWPDFDEYCRWLFPLLQEVSDNIDITHYTPLQQRIYGYMSERLLLVWLTAKKKTIIRKPVIWFTELDDPMRHAKRWKYVVRCLLNNLSVAMSRPRYANIMNRDYSSLVESKRQSL